MGLIEFRPFRNTDPPRLAEIWCGEGNRPSLAQPMSTHVLEEFVLAKPYFDREGLIVAVRDGRPVGFVHAGFGPTDDECSLQTDWGVTCLMVTCGEDEATIRTGLLHQSEEYLRSRGALVLYGGCVQPLTPFYVGLYGGSELPGVLDCDDCHQQLYLDSGYREIDRTAVVQTDTANFRPVVNRDQLMIRRRTIIEAAIDPPATSWWQACMWNQFERTEFRLRDKCGGEIIARAAFRGMDPQAHCHAAQRAGLIAIETSEEHRRQGLATFLLGESIKQLRQHGVTMIEAITMAENTPAMGLYRKLGFAQVASGAVYRKQ